jgi:hypothetical protein
MKFPKLPKSLEWLTIGLAIVAVVMNPSALSNVGSTEWFLQRVAFITVILGTYYFVGPKYGLYAAGAVAVFFWFQQTKERMEVEGKAIEGTTCPPNFNFDIAVQMCKDDKGALVPPTQVRCESGFKPNETNDKCIQDVPPDAPSPPPPGPPPNVEEPAPPAASTGSATAESAAPAKGTEKFEGKGTIATTPGEAQEKAKNTVVLQQQSSVESFGNWGPGFPLK